MLYTRTISCTRLCKTTSSSVIQVTLSWEAVCGLWSVFLAVASRSGRKTLWTKWRIECGAHWLQVCHTCAHTHTHTHTHTHIHTPSLSGVPAWKTKPHRIFSVHHPSPLVIRRASPPHRPFKQPLKRASIPQHSELRSVLSTSIMWRMKVENERFSVLFNVTLASRKSGNEEFSRRIFDNFWKFSVWRCTQCDHSQHRPETADPTTQRYIQEDLKLTKLRLYLAESISPLLQKPTW